MSKRIADPASARSSNVCRYFSNEGYCMYGENCNFQHIAAPASQNLPINSSNPRDVRYPASEPKTLLTRRDDEEYLASVSKASPPRAPNTSQRHPSPRRSNIAYYDNRQNSSIPSYVSSAQHKGPLGANPDPQLLPQFKGLNIGQSQGVGIEQAPHYGPEEVADSTGGVVYFYPHNPSFSAASNLPSSKAPWLHAYPSQLPHVAAPLGKERVLQSFFMSENLRQELRHRNDLILQTVEQEESSLPYEVDQYHSLYPLDQNMYERSPKTFGYFTSCYKVISSTDGLPYCMRRIEGYRLMNEKTMVAVDQWKRVQHTNIVTLREVFTTKDFGDHSLIFIYDYHPGADNMMKRHFMTERKGFLQEALIWSYIIQLTSALRAIHAAGLACRVVDPTKIIFTAKNRVRINCICVFDILNFDSATNKNLITHLQQEDLVALGRLILSLACNSLMALQRENFVQSMDRISAHYSTDLKNLVGYLLALPSPHIRPKSVNDLMPMIGARFYTEIECLSLYNDVLESELSKELENGRLFRLLCKLGFIHDRPEYEMDPNWAETGDRQIVQLFKDFLFHQVMEGGEPVVDLGHVIQSLNKLDTGFHERICLFSRDEQNIIVISYAQLKSFIEKSFNELLGHSSSI